MAFAKVVINQTGAIREFEKPEVCKAIKVANANKWVVGLSLTEWDERKARLKKEYEENTKATGSGGDQPKEVDLKAATKMFGAQAREIMRLTAENAELRETIDKMKEGNPALKEALNESASQFNDCLLNEQAKKIEELTMENERLKDQVAVLYAYKEHNENFDRKQIKRLVKEIARLNKIIHKKNLKIDEMRKESSRHLEGKMKMFGENFDLEQELKDKNAVLSDVSEELRLSKIREKNLTEVCQKYMKENEELKKELADKVVDKIDAQALKSAESALAYKEKVIADLTKKLKSINMNRHNERIYKKQLAEKDDVIADLGKELTESKKRVEWVRNASKEYCDYGVAANEFIKELAHLYVLASNNGNIDVEMLERCKNYQTYGFPANCNRETKKEINDIARGKTKVVGVDIAEEGEDYYGKIVLCDKICTRKIEEIEIEKAVKLVRKAMKEGHTVTINYKD